jgi:zinc protease
VQDLTRDDLVAFHRNYHPAATTIAVVGDVDPAAVIAELERHFGGWRVAGDPPGIVLPPAPAPAGALRRAIPVAGKSQADLVWAVPGLARNSPDFYPAMVGNLILGQLGMYGRLGESVREEQGMAYYITSNLDADLGPGPWSVAAGVNPANVERTVAAILHEIEQFKRDGPDAEELADAQSYLTGSLALGLETNDGIAGVLLLIERHKLGLDHLDRYPSRIRAITREQIVEVARRYLSTDSYVLAVAGPIA